MVGGILWYKTLMFAEISIRIIPTTNPETGEVIRYQTLVLCQLRTRIRRVRLEQELTSTLKGGFSLADTGRQVQ